VKYKENKVSPIFDWKIQFSPDTIWFPNSYFNAWRRRYQGGVSGRNGLSFRVHRDATILKGWIKKKCRIIWSQITWQPIFELKGYFRKKYI
jgi:hypothetical protein